MMWVIKVGLCILLVCLNHIRTEPGEYLDEFVIRVPDGIHHAYQIAKEHGFRTVKRAVSMNDVFILADHHSVRGRSRRAAGGLIERLAAHPLVTHAHQELELKRVKREIVYDKQHEFSFRRYEDKSVFKRVDVSKLRQTKGNIPEDMNFNDPHYHDQWYLNNYGQTGGISGLDINVVPVWKKGITGAGTVVTILDDGLDHDHDDLKKNYDPEASWDMNSNDTDPMPNKDVAGNNHGTHCAGEIAAEANNSVCGVGVAYHAKVGGIRILDGAVTDRIEADALLYKNNHTQIYSASWGPTDDGATMEGPHELASAALKEGITNGRNGLGSIFIWATGNGGGQGDSCSCDGYVSSIYTVSIGSISNKGLSTYYSEMCPSTMGVIFTGGSNKSPGEEGYTGQPEINVVTTDWNNGCTLNFIGTSAAAPMAAGCAALTLEANPGLTWRDFQYILAKTSRIPNSEESGWTYNGNGYHVNPHFGFGMLDCGMMVQEAQNWENVPEQAQYDQDGELPDGGEVPATSNLQLFMEVTKSDCNILNLEHVELHMKLDAKIRGKVNMQLISPFGTASEILPERPHDSKSKGIDFTFMTVHTWGEDPVGTWTLNVRDLTDKGNDIVINKWSMTFYGVKDALQSVHQPNYQTQAYNPDTKTLNSDMASEKKDSDDVNIKAIQEKNVRELLYKVVDKLDDEEVDAILKEAKDLEMESNENNAAKSRTYKSRKYSSGSRNSKKKKVPTATLR